MSRSAESFTLLESGTSRLHFKLAKELEEASSSRQQDAIILSTVASIRKQLASRSFSSDAAKLTSALLTLLHCLQHYPCSAGFTSEERTTIDASFALLSTLQLLSLATSWRQLLIAYELLPFLLPRDEQGSPRNTSNSADDYGSPSSPIATPSRAAVSTFDDSSSLLLLNTFRINLSAASAQAESAPSRSSSRTRSRSPSTSRSLRREKQDGATSQVNSDLITFKALASLKSLVTGTPRGSAVLPSLASTLVALTRHPDSSIRTMTLNAMLSCAAIPAQDSADKEGKVEMLDAALTIVRLTLASTYAFSAGSNLEEQHGMILAEMERRVDCNPSILRACIKVVNRCRDAGMISNEEAVCHALEALQATRWAPMHLEMSGLQQQRLAATISGRTEGLRARTASRQRPSLQVEHDYHGAYAPWLVDACLSSVTISIQKMQPSSQLDRATRKELLVTVLRIYHTASQGKAAALALCVSSARSIGALHLASSIESASAEQLSPLHSADDRDGELAALWGMLSVHLKSQLHSTNPNRKVAAISMLDALLPLGWAQATSNDDVGGTVVEQSPSWLNITEADMGQLMALLSDPDASIRKRALALLHRVDSSLTALLRSQLQVSVDDAISARRTHGPGFAPQQPDSTLIAAAQRLVEVALFAVSSDIDSSFGSKTMSDEAMAALESSLASAIALNIFGDLGPRSSSEEGGWTAMVLIAIASLPIGHRVELLQRLWADVFASEAATASSNGLNLCCRLLIDLNVGDLSLSQTTAEAYTAWVGTELLSSHGLIGTLVGSSSDGRNVVAVREMVLGVTARTISLAAQLEADTHPSQPVIEGLATIQATLTKLVETESVPAVRLEASNLLLVCRAVLAPASQRDDALFAKVKALARAHHSMQDAARALLELQAEDRTEDSRSMSSTPSETSILATASQFFTSSSRSSSESNALADSFAALRLRPQLPSSILQSSRLLSPDNSTDTLRSTRYDPATRRSPTTNASVAKTAQTSAIPPEFKRLRDQGIAKAMSDSIANLVLGADARAQPSDNEVIFSATSSEILAADELEVVNEVADPERRLDLTVAQGRTPSLLDLVHQCHNHDPWLDTSLTPFVLDGVQIGFLPARVVKACVDDSAAQVRAGAPPVLRKVRFVMHHREILPPTMSTRTCEAITFTADYATPEARTAGLNAVAQRWREARIFPDPLDGWRDELYAIYGLNPRPGTRNPIAFKLERAACALFGLATFGVHLTAYTTDPTTGELKVWVPQRSSTKSTWPGYLDNSVAGGIVAGDLPMESMIRECEEEANLPPSLVEKHIKQTGVLSYCYKTANQGWIQPEVEYVYDLPLPGDVTLQPKDGEVDHFELMSLEEAYEKMRLGRFKANCVLVMLDFLIRHGYVTAENEEGYRQIVAQLHVDLRLPGP